jgi:FKBP-type peptidyl-prolyl cis-trans isomerase
MKKLTLFTLLYIIVLGTSSCLKDNECQDKTIQSEAAAIAAYASANGIVGTTHSSGVYYQVTVPGTGITPTANSTVSVRYTGKLITTGAVFDSQTGSPVNFPLGGTIQGFRIGLQQVGKGGTIKFIIPSSLAYGCTGNGNIPSNSILYFEVQLVDVL